ncbi:MAG TPA: hypothetical protein VGF69_19220 [Thermoanaerobaculia bacterium]|jgi:hypothetical protein
MPREVIVSARARWEILDAELWWRANRDKAPTAFTDELDRALYCCESSRKPAPCITAAGAVRACTG